MKNLRTQFKIIIYLAVIFFISPNILEAKKLDKYSKAEDISNYFSGLLSIKNSDYENTHGFLKKLKGLEKDHYNYAYYFQYSLVSLERFKDAVIFSKKLEKQNLDNFESNLVSGIYYLKKGDTSKAKIYFKKLSDKNKEGTVQNLLSVSLNNWIKFPDIKDINLASDLLKTTPKRFENIKNIQNFYLHCYYDSQKIDIEFKKLISNPSVDYSRYYFFYYNFYFNKKKYNKSEEILNTAIQLHPRNLILNQFKYDVIQKNNISDKFDCKNLQNITAELFFIIANALAIQNNYSESNFYLNIAKYLNPSFKSFDALNASNFYRMEKYELSKKLYNNLKDGGKFYDWYASKKISSILVKQGKNDQGINVLRQSFKKIDTPSIYELFDLAEFLKNNEKYKDSIEFYKEVLKKISKNHFMYAEVENGLGIAHERTGHWKKAEKNFKNSLSVSPDDAYVINYLAYSWIEQGMNIEESLLMLKKANSLRPNDGYITDSLGWALFKLNKYSEAQKYLERAVLFMASDPVINDHYADSLWMTNKKLQARYYWRYVLNLEKTEDELKKIIRQKLLFGLNKI